MSQEPTNADLYTALGRVEAKQDMLLDRYGDQEKRVRTLEQHRNWFAGVIAACGSLGVLSKARELF